MKINKFIKKKDGFYNVFLENGEEISVHEDLILKHDLLLKRELDESLKEKIQEENINYILYNKAIKYIGIKLRSVFEMEKYLDKLSEDKSMIDSVIDILKSQGYLDDKNYSIAYVNDKINLSNDGPEKIKNFLLKNKIDNIYINSALQNYTKEVEIERINKLINKYIKTNNNKGFALLKQKILANLINLGYDKPTVLEELNKIDVDDKELYKKEYDKLHEKLSKKYSGFELEYRIKQKLYQKGFVSYYSE